MAVDGVLLKIISEVDLAPVLISNHQRNFLESHGHILPAFLQLNQPYNARIAMASEAETLENGASLDQ